jgi:hypothetical protein
MPPVPQATSSRVAARPWRRSMMLRMNAASMAESPVTAS